MADESPKRVITRRKPRDSAKMFRDEMRPNLVVQQQEWLDWNGKCYVVIEHATIVAEIAAWADDAFEKMLIGPSEEEREKAAQEGREPEGTIGYRKFEPKPVDTAAIATSLTQLVHRPAEQFPPPCWLKIAKPYVGIDPRDIIVCENGLLDMRTGKRHPHTPAFFTRSAIPIVHDANAPKPVLWLQCLEQWFKGRQPLADLLQECIGYSLSSDTSQQVVIMMWGVPRGGKGTVLRIINNLVGPENVHAPSIMELSGRFGLQGCIDKPLITITDMDVDSKTEVGAAAVSINKISGEDRVSVERKNKDPWSGTLPGRIWVVSNHLPDFGTHTMAIIARLLILPFEVSFLGHEDRQLTAKLRAELPGILNWALKGLARLRDRNRFPDCPESEEAKIRMLHVSEPIRGFVEEKCELGDFHIDKAVMYPRYRNYCRSVGVHPMPANKFSERLMYLYPTIGASKRSASDDTRPPIFDGIRFNEHEAMKLYRIATDYKMSDIDPGLGCTFWDIVARDEDGEPALKLDVETDFAE
jgi:putative DNA primase/helicase